MKREVEVQMEQPLNAVEVAPPFAAPPRDAFVARLVDDA